MNHFPNHMRRDEADVADALLTAFFNRQLTVSIHDGEEWSVKKSTDRAELERETAATGVTGYRLRTADGEYAGFFTLIHGNGRDVIHDWSANELCEDIWNEVEPVTELEWME